MVGGRTICICNIYIYMRKIFGGHIGLVLWLGFGVYPKALGPSKWDPKP